jgi:hypothetical protein
MSPNTDRPSFAEFGSLSNTPYGDRLRRYDLIVAMSDGLPPFERRHSLRQIAALLVLHGYGRISAERVRQLLDQGPPRHSYSADKIDL